MQMQSKTLESEEALALVVVVDVQGTVMAEEVCNYPQLMLLISNGTNECSMSTKRTGVVLEVLDEPDSSIREFALSLEC
ncbi:hypothetical protein L1987_08457 [Smallanthus sonchifolius]|uniref:Uncharacterized protein n=1 Tax=Smallanthus sonchifolius TaxID=185202 RepID=A0ACB9JKS4_9ASTR|nr:hypothetical protein L1987_08457 [Smallanthus sonchifolius]